MNLRGAKYWMSAALIATCGALGGCSASDDTGETHDNFTSPFANLYDFEFESELDTKFAGGSPDAVIRQQLLYTVGQLNGQLSVGRLDAVKITILEKKSVTGGVHIKYHAVLPVAWSKKRAVPSSFEFIVPRDVSTSGIAKFTEKYGKKCGDAFHESESSNFWYFYRPNGCPLEADDVIRTKTISIKPGSTSSQGSYPEYDKIFDDGVLNAVVIFSKNEIGGGNKDVGVVAFRNFIQSTRSMFNATTKVTPVADMDSYGIEIPEVRLDVTVEKRKAVITAFMIDKITEVDAAFDAKYSELTKTADFIAYNGHSDLGNNVRALSRKGEWAANKYVIFFMNGCDTFSYVDGSLAKVRAILNPTDPTGTKYLDMIVNAMPAPFSSDAHSTYSIISGLLRKPELSYNQILANVDPSQVILTVGDEDNSYKPPPAPPAPNLWDPNAWK